MQTKKNKQRENVNTVIPIIKLDVSNLTDLFTFKSLLSWKSWWPCDTRLPLQAVQENNSDTDLWQMSKQNKCMDNFTRDFVN